MDTFTVIQGFLLVAFAINGLTQLIMPQASYASLPKQGWANDFKPWQFKMIALLKVFAILGIVAALFVPSLAMLRPMAALGLALLMAGAMATHLRREEYINVLGNIVFLGLWLFVAYSTLTTLAI